MINLIMDIIRHSEIYNRANTLMSEKEFNIEVVKLRNKIEEILKESKKQEI